jgi:hypothetical protein
MTLQERYKRIKNLPAGSNHRKYLFDQKYSHYRSILKNDPSYWINPNDKGHYSHWYFSQNICEYSVEELKQMEDIIIKKLNTESWDKVKERVFNGVKWMIDNPELGPVAATTKEQRDYARYQADQYVVDLIAELEALEETIEEKETVSQFIEILTQSKGKEVKR